MTGTGFTLGGADAGNYSLVSVGTTTATISQRAPGRTWTTRPPRKSSSRAPPTSSAVTSSRSALDLGGLAFGFAPEDQGKELDPTNQPLFAIGCPADCDDQRQEDGRADHRAGASAAATKKMKLKTQNMSLAAGELGVVKLKLTKKQKKAIKKAKKAKLVVKLTVTSGGQTATDKKTYRLKAKNGLQPAEPHESGRAIGGGAKDSRRPCFFPERSVQRPERFPPGWPLVSALRNPESEPRPDSFRKDFVELPSLTHRSTR